jgi:DNA-binding transcriptional ArsR family regulator
MVNEFPAGASVGRTFSGLADPTRRAIVGMLAERPLTFGDVAAAFPVSKPAVSRHLRLLREAGLVVEAPVATDGRLRMYSLRREPIEQLDAWIEQLRRFWLGQLEEFRREAVAEAERIGQATGERPNRSEREVQ